MSMIHCSGTQVIELNIYAMHDFAFICQVDAV